MLTTSIFPGRYVQGAGAIDALGDEAGRFGESPIAIVDAYVCDHMYDDIARGLGSSEPRIERFGGECSQVEIDRQVDLTRRAGADVVIGVGGGKTLDTAKAVAYELKTPVVIAPTLASTDAPCSALSVIYRRDGVFERYLVLPNNPNVVLVDSEIISSSPTRFLVSGMGDALATWFEAQSCDVRNAANMTGRPGTMTAYALARLCYETLISYGRLARVASEEKCVTPAFEHVVEANTLLSGLGFESGGLAACHAIHNGLTALPSTHAHWHGEKVAIGVLASLFLTDQSSDQIDEVYCFCRDVGLPTTLEEIGLSNPTDDDLRCVAEIACAEGETIHNEPHEVRPEVVAWALKTADAEGRRRR